MSPGHVVAACGGLHVQEFPCNFPVLARVGFSPGLLRGEEPVMAERGMEVDTEHLNAGADRCGDAAGTALAAAGELAEMKPAAGDVR